jgi:hypothetical protein
VPYIVCSRGIPIGTTDLAFARLTGRDRMGWFVPNPEGERLMPVVAAMHRAIRGITTIVGRETSPPAMPLEPGMDADDALERALADVEALELTLHREDGVLVRTYGVSIADTQTLRELYGDEPAPDELENLAPWEREEDDQPDAEPQDEMDAALAAEIDEDLRRMLELDGDDAAPDESGRFDPPAPWEPDDVDDVDGLRYQVHVRLVDESAIP